MDNFRKFVIITFLSAFKNALVSRQHCRFLLDENDVLDIKDIHTSFGSTYLIRRLSGFEKRELSTTLSGCASVNIVP
jgi:hypothetical protein